jgi:hypothetical protein
MLKEDNLPNLDQITKEIGKVKVQIRNSKIRDNFVMNIGVTPS